MAARLASKSCLAAVLVVLIGISADGTLCRGQEPDADVAGAQVLTRGPVHEAFAGMATFNPEPGVVVAKAPPEVIEEVPPEERPEGDNVAWIPGYWAWDDERTDFLWVSGTWRALPPGRQWMAGYWGQSAQGYQWTSGYWADATARETTYLPPPPATVEAGPNIAAPSVDYGWSPGCWIWYQGRYAWRPGYWAQGRADWDWMPAHYVWTPRGCIFVGGYWDYSVERRGVLFAPVYFESGVYSRRGYSYSPTIVIDLGIFTDHLFLRPSYHHYYFGDYYAPSYHQGGFYASFSFQSSRYGYDPIYSHQRWEHRQDREWEHRVQTSYQYRRDNEAARPPRTWTAQRSINPGTTEAKQNRVMVATSLNQLSKRTDGPMRFQPVPSAERQGLAQRGQEVQKSREQRRTLEATAVTTTALTPVGVTAPVKAPLPRSPIVAKQASQLGRNQAPPEAQRAPKAQSRPATPGRAPVVGRSNPQPEPRKAEVEKQPAPVRSQTAPGRSETAPGRSETAPGRSEAAPARSETAPLRSEAAPRERPMQPDAQPRVKDSGANASGVAQRQVSEQPARPRPAPVDKGAAQLIKRDRENPGKGKASRETPPAQPPTSANGDHRGQ